MVVETFEAGHGAIAAAMAAIPTITAYLKNNSKKKAIQDFMTKLEDSLEDDHLTKQEIRKLIREGRRL